MDGTPTLRMNEFMLATLALGKADLGTPSGETLPAPTELPFELNVTTRALISGAEARFDTLVGEHELHVLHYEGYGKNAIKQFKASPDAWAQLVKQLAFHKMFGRPGVTYESAQTRKFQLGRTEVIRSASSETKAWAEAMLDPTGSDATRAALFRKAVTRHLQYAAWAADGQGVDRHLFGLKKMLRDGEEVPEVYRDQAFARTSHWELSTSQLSSPYLDGWGYGEVVPDGYGLSYAIGDAYIRWTITSKRGDAADLRHYLAEAATETKEMMERVVKAEAKEKGKL
jgi:carnitine O-acetyltransferase